MGRPSEDELIARYFAPLAGPGGLGLEDDAALISPPAGHELVLTKDALVAGVHFFADDPPHAIAQKALRVNLSDLAAKGAEPLGFLLALALPEDWSAAFLEGFAAGLADDIAAFRFPLLGGDTVKTPGPLTLSITAIGAVPFDQMVPRTGVMPDDRIYVSGSIGDSALGLILRLNGEAHTPWAQAIGVDACAYLKDRYLLPQPRVGLRKVLRAQASGGMDVSDGLIGDLTKMLRVSEVTATIELSKIPLSLAGQAALKADPALFESMVCGGDDYEILASVPEAHVEAFEASARAAGVEVTLIGVADEGDAPPTFLNADGSVQRFGQGSFSHFTPE